MTFLEEMGTSDDIHFFVRKNSPERDIRSTASVDLRVPAHIFAGTVA